MLSSFELNHPIELHHFVNEFMKWLFSKWSSLVKILGSDWEVHLVLSRTNGSVHCNSCNKFQFNFQFFFGKCKA